MDGKLHISRLAQFPGFKTFLKSPNRGETPLDGGVEEIESPTQGTCNFQCNERKQTFRSCSCQHRKQQPTEDVSDEESWESCSSNTVGSSRSHLATIRSTENNFVVRSYIPRTRRYFPRIKTTGRLHLPQLNQPLEPRVPEPTPAPFKYDPLEGDDIRVIEILPDREYKMVSCLMHHTPIYRGEKFDALSYCWGSEPRDHLILINGHTFQVSRNLEAALVQFRRENMISRKDPMEKLETAARKKGLVRRFAPRQDMSGTNAKRIWVDAICIDQDDIPERNRQVRLMRHIYSGAVRLKIWLGVPEKRSGLAINIIKRHAQTLVSEGQDAVLKLVDEYNVDAVLMGLYALGYFFTRPWFRRAWILQEYALGCKAAPVFYCGHKQIPWFAISMFVEWEHKFDPRGIVLKDESNIPHPTLFHLRAVIDEENGSVYRDIVQRIGLTNAIGALYSEGMASWAALEAARLSYFANQESLLDWVHYSRICLATDPRDKIYSVLGIVENILARTNHKADFHPEMLIVDYGASVQDVYSSVVRAVVTKTKSLDILIYPSRPGGRIDRTWTPDWSLDHSFRRLAYAHITFCDSQGEGFRDQYYTRPLHASPGTTAEATFADDLSILTVKGIIWDRIDAVFGPPNQLSIRVKPIFHDMFRFAQECRHLSTLYHFHHRLSRCLPITQGVRSHVIRATNTYDPMKWEPILDMWMKQWRAEIHEDSDEGELLGVIEQTINRWDMFGLTSLGYVCRSRNVIRPGDFVCVLLGCRVPVILRPVAEYFEVIGEVFCEGIMRGEAAIALEKGERDLRTFELH